MRSTLACIVERECKGTMGVTLSIHLSECWCWGIGQVIGVWLAFLLSLDCIGSDS